MQSWSSDVEAVSHDPHKLATNTVWVEPRHQARDSTLEVESQIIRMGFWDRLTVGGHATVGWGQSILAIVTYSWLNIFIVFVPIAWVAHFSHNESHKVVFALTLVALLPLIKLLHYTGDQLALNCSRTAGDVIIITANNLVETALAVILLCKCELKLLQSSITGFILLRLLLVSGTAFITGGLRRKEQMLHSRQSGLNRTLLLMGTLTLLLPALFYNTLDHNSGVLYVPGAVDESLRGQILGVSRALSPMLLVAYICSCYYIHYPPGGEDVFSEKDMESLDESYCPERPEVNFWTSLVVMFVTGGMMTVTAEFLISNLQPMKNQVGIQEEFFGLVLIPVVSFSADAVLASVFFFRSQLRHCLGTPWKSGGCLAETRSIDLSIQFMLFWTPLLVLIAWILNKPLSLLFDMFEVVLLLAASFLLNYVTFDSKTNWAEGVMLVTFYIMIVITAWFYPGKEDIRGLLSCNT